VAQVRAAVLAADLGADHAVGGVAHVLDEVTGGGLPVAGPAAARVEFGVGLEEFDPAANALVGALLEVVPVAPAERRLGGGVSRDAVGQRLGLAELLAPFGIGLLDGGVGGVAHDEQETSMD
jgi:hypothetical protein